MNEIARTIAIGYLALLASPTMAQQIVTCEPVWAQLSKEIGGGKVAVNGLKAGNHDPHHFTPTVRSIALAQRADLLICSDIKDRPPVKSLVRRSGNPKIQPGRPGYLEATEYVRAHMAQGHPQPLGWHHLQLDPRNILLVAQAITQRLAEIDSANAGYYQTRYQAFSLRWNAAIVLWEHRAAPLKSTAIVEQRMSCQYLCRWLGIREIATVEPVKGGSVTARQMRKVLAALQNQPVTMIVKGPYHNSAAVSWLTQKTKLPLVIIPAMVDTTSEPQNMYSMFDVLIDRMLAAASPASRNGRNGDQARS